MTIDSLEQLKAIADPLRQQLLNRFAREPATTKQVAVALGLKPTRLYHHVAKLEKCGLIKLVETRPVRGTTEKYYQASASSIMIDRRVFSGEGARLASDHLSLKYIDNLWAGIRGDIAEYLQDDDADDSSAEEEIIFAQGEIEVDEETAAILKQKLMTAIEEIDAEATERGGRDDAKKTYRMVVGWYPRPGSTSLED